VSTVTRYWGVPPASTGLQVHGEGLGILGSSSCGNQAGAVGLVGYNWVDQTHLDTSTEPQRPLPSIDTRPFLDGFTATTHGALTPRQEAGLTERFGEPTVLMITSGDRVAAMLMAWQYHLIALVLVAGIAVFLVLRMRRTHATATATPGASDSTDDRSV